MKAEKWHGTITEQSMGQNFGNHLEKQYNMEIYIYIYMHTKVRLFHSYNERGLGTRDGTALWLMR